MSLQVKVKKLSDNATEPKYMTKGASGFDLSSAADLQILPGETRIIPTDLAFAIPEGYEMQVRPRSGMSLNTKLRVANAPGTVDADFRGPVGIIMTNTGASNIAIKKGDRVAQGVIAPVKQAEFEFVEDLDATERGSGAFGSTGAN